MKSKNLSEKILRSVKSKGFKYIELPSVIEANHIVQRSGENFRKFMFSFMDQNGSELCLRPDLTIASCLRYLENNLKGKEKIFYSGQAYRKSQNKKDSIIRNQIGFEILGSKDEKNDDKEIINTSLKSLQNIKYSSGTLTIGNVEIFNLLISKLDIPKRWKLRLSRHFWREEYFNDLLKRLEDEDRYETEEFIANTSRIIGLGAVKYADLSQNRITNYQFSFDKMLSLNGNTAPYLLYTLVRIAGIKRKNDFIYDSKDFQYLNYEHKSEWKLIRKLLRFDEVIISIEKDLMPNRLCNYLFELCQTFNRFYDQVPILKEEKYIKISRLNLCDLTAKTLKLSLELLGIETLERM